MHRHDTRFLRLSLFAIFVSFVHMASAMAMFGAERLHEQAAALGMTLIIDLTLWIVADYLHDAATRKQESSIWIKAVFALALIISVLLNAAYLWSHRPAALPDWLSMIIAGSFALLISGVVVAASIARSEIAATTQAEIDLTQAAQATARTLREREHELTTTAQALRIERERADQTAHALAHAQTALAQAEQALAHAQAEAAQRGADQPMDRVDVARRLIELGESQRRAAQILNLSESTLRNWLRNGNGLAHKE